jgi:hypothetical protein
LLRSAFKKENRTKQPAAKPVEPMPTPKMRGK